MGTTWPQHRFELEAVHLSHAADDDDEFCFARHAGHVSDIPGTSLGVQPARTSTNHGAVHGGCDHRRSRFRLISDRWGRKRSMILALICAIAVVPLWAYAPSLALLVLGAFLLQFMVQGAWGIVP